MMKRVKMKNLVSLAFLDKSFNTYGYIQIFKLMIFNGSERHIRAMEKSRASKHGGLDDFRLWK